MGLRSAYLVLYNLASTGAWSLLLYHLVNFTLSGQKQESIYKELAFYLKIAQSTAILEVVHASFKIVRANPVNTFIQVLSRIAVLYFLLDFFEEAAVPITIFGITIPHVSIMLYAWCFAEIPRYLFLACNLVTSKPPYILTFLRYSGFLILYPLGVFGELCVFAQGMPEIEKNYSSSWPFFEGDVSLPNRFNFSFTFYQFMMLGMYTYIPGLPLLYSHMLSQRAKKLSPSKKEKAH